VGRLVSSYEESGFAGIEDIYKTPRVFTSGYRVRLIGYRSAPGDNGFRH